MYVCFEMVLNNLLINKKSTNMTDLNSGLAASNYILHV